jgi:hypothetical protein
MSRSVDNFTLNKTFWAHFAEHITSMRFGDMQHDVHTSLSFNSNSPDVNFHFTRNIGKVESEKPKIEIVRISKQDLDLFTPYLGTIFFNSLLAPLYLRKYGRKKNAYHYGTRYYPMDEVPENWIAPIMQEELLKLTTVKGRRARIDTDLENHFKKIMDDNGLDQHFEKSLKWLPVHSDLQHALIISKGFTGSALQFNGQWYRIRTDVNFAAMAKGIMPDHLIQSIAFKMDMAYQRICRMTTRAQSEIYNNPIRLFVQPPKENP